MLTLSNKKVKRLNDTKSALIIVAILLMIIIPFLIIGDLG